MALACGDRHHGLIIYPPVVFHHIGNKMGDQKVAPTFFAFYQIAPADFCLLPPPYMAKDYLLLIPPLQLRTGVARGIAHVGYTSIQGYNGCRWRIPVHHPNCRYPIPTCYHRLHPRERIVHQG
jgi:hypothetical protein